MSLYLCVLDADDGEYGGVDVGRYSDFADFRQAVREHLGAERCPTLLLHSDCDGSWTPEECERLEAELVLIGNTFGSLPPRPLVDWQAVASVRLGRQPMTLYESFPDASGQPIVGRLLKLCAVARQTGMPILFQ